MGNCLFKSSGEVTYRSKINENSYQRTYPEANPRGKAADPITYQYITANLKVNVRANVGVRVGVGARVTVSLAGLFSYNSTADKH
jgi:hypothetical protein